MLSLIERERMELALRCAPIICGASSQEIERIAGGLYVHLRDNPPVESSVRSLFQVEGSCVYN